MYHWIPYSLKISNHFRISLTTVNLKHVLKMFLLLCPIEDIVSQCNISRFSHDVLCILFEPPYT